MPRTRTPQIVPVDNLRLRQLLAAGVPLVDVRRAEEWEATGVVPGSRLLTFFGPQGECDTAAWLRRLATLVPTGSPLALICRSGYRTGLIAPLLLEVGLAPMVYDVREGILGWLEAGLPVKSPGPGA